MAVRFMGDVTDHISSDCQELDDVQRLELLNTLGKFSSLFSSLPGLAKVKGHNLKLKPDFTQKKMHPYRIPIALQQEVDRQINELLHLKLIEPRERKELLADFNGRGKALHGLCDSSWSLPILCYAFRDEERREYLSKSYGSGASETPGILSIIYRRCSNFLQNMGTAHKTSVCSISNDSKGQFTINLNKCNFARRRVKFLGHVVGSGQHSPDPGKVESIKNISVPTTKKEIRSFLGLTSYYREYIPNFASLVLPLTELTKNRVPNIIPWNEVAEQAFTN
ncbi:retrovirus-related Pol polyprotein from transposon 17.6 [Trichonephila clavipes]|nr:retrovirus-related Pol polyprotein from transposon 17.6 [Trichonephila clavipes]